MLLFWRKFLFYILLIAYLLITPYAIMYALGYIVGPGKGDFINKTGLLSIESEPKGARVYVNGRRFSRTTPSAVRDLLPGEYDVEVVKKGFERWSKKISVYSEKATRLEPVVLLPSNIETETLSERAYGFFLPLMLDFRVFGLLSDDLESLKGTDIFLKRTFDVGEKAALDGKYEVEDFRAKAGSNLVLFEVRQNGKKSWQTLQLNWEKESRNIGGFMPAEPDLVDWDAKATEFIFFLKDGVLSALDWHKQKLYSALVPDALGFGVKGGKLYVLKKDWTLWVSPAKPEALKLEPVEETVLPKPDAGVKWVQIEAFKREFFQKDLLLFLTDRGALLSSRAPYVLAEEGVRGFQYAMRGEDEKILFWTKNELYSTLFSKENEEHGKIPAVTVLLTGKASDIRQVFWAYDSSHALFLDGPKVFLAEERSLEPYYVRPVMTVLPEAPIFYHELTHSIYYLDPRTRHLMRRKVTE